ncbi:hypothetical protein D3C81_1724910 [compost metagenome]
MREWASTSSLTAGSSCDNHGFSNSTRRCVAESANDELTPTHPDLFTQQIPDSLCIPAGRTILGRSRERNKQEPIFQIEQDLQTDAETTNGQASQFHPHGRQHPGRLRHHRARGHGLRQPAAGADPGPSKAAARRLRRLAHRPLRPLPADRHPGPARWP